MATYTIVLTTTLGQLAEGAAKDEARNVLHALRNFVETKSRDVWGAQLASEDINDENCIKIGTIART